MITKPESEQQTQTGSEQVLPEVEEAPVITKPDTKTKPTITIAKSKQQKVEEAPVITKPDTKTKPTITIAKSKQQTQIKPKQEALDTAEATRAITKLEQILTKKEKVIIVLPSDRKLKSQIVNFIQKKENKGEIITVKPLKIKEESLTEVKESKEVKPDKKTKRVIEGLGQRYNTAIFRLFTWRSMIRQLIRERAVVGFDFGKPLRSEEVEIAQMAYGEWSRDGWMAAHNSYLEIIYRSGIIGIILILSFFIVFFRLTKSLIKLKSFTGICLVSIMVYWMITAFFYVTFEMPYSAIFFWSLFGITLTYSRKTHAAVGIKKIGK